MKEEKQHLYGISIYTGLGTGLGKGLTFHWGRRIVCIYHLRGLKFKIRKYGENSFDTWERHGFNGDFLGLQLYK